MNEMLEDKSERGRIPGSKSKDAKLGYTLANSMQAYPMKALILSRKQLNIVIRGDPPAGDGYE